MFEVFAYELAVAPDNGIALDSFLICVDSLEYGLVDAVGSDRALYDGIYIAVVADVIETLHSLVVTCLTPLRKSVSIGYE